MSIVDIDRCTFGQHESHEVITCDGTKYWGCSEKICMDHREHCFNCDSDVCPACMQEHRDGDCFTTEDEDDNE